MGYLSFVLILLAQPIEVVLQRFHKDVLEVAQQFAFLPELEKVDFLKHAGVGFKDELGLAEL